MKNRDCWAEYDNDNGGDDDIVHSGEAGRSFLGSLPIGVIRLGLRSCRG